MNLPRFALACALTASVFTADLPADTTKAEDDAYSMSVYYAQRGFAMSPTNYSSLAGSGQSTRYLMAVSKGVDYVFLVGVDQFVKDLDLYVYDEVGTLIIDDRRLTARAGVKFRSSYNGTVQVYVHVARVTSFAAYAVLVGRRGVAAGASSSPIEPVGAPPEGEEPVAADPK